MKTFLTKLIFAVILSGAAYAQPLTPDWEISLPGKLKWMQVNDWGILVASCDNGLYGVNPVDGSRLWELPGFANVPEENYNVIAGTPLVLVEQKGSAGRTVVINGLNGEVVFDSQAEQISSVLSRQLIPGLNGLLIVYTKEAGTGMALYNYLRAEKMWDTPFGDVKDASLKVDPIVDTDAHILYCAGKFFFRINGQNGEILWQQESKKKYIDLFVHPSGNTVFAVSGTPSSAFFASHGGEGAKLASGTAGAFEINAYDIASGAAAWKDAVSYSRSKYSGVLLGSGDFFLLHTFSANKIAYDTGEKIWAKEKMGAGGEVCSHVFTTDKGLLYAAQDAVGRNYLNYMDAEGSPLWKKRPVINGDILLMEQRGDKLFYISTQETNFIHLEDGGLLWEKDKYLSSGEVPLSVDKDDDGYIMYARGMLVKVKPAEQDWQKITSDFAFRGELPTGIRSLPNGYLLTGNQNAMLLGTDGKLIYHKFYEAPEQSFGAKLAFGALSTASSLASFAYGVSGLAYGVSGALEDNDDFRKKSSRQFAAASFAGEAADGLGALVSARFGENAAADNYKLILTKTDKSIGFVKLNVLTGQEEGQIVTNDRTPDFAIDSPGKKVFLKSAADRVACYGL